MNYLKSAGFMLLLVFVFPCRGQQLLFNNISNQVGLPAQECYNIMQDSKGFIWISTEAGLCKYNGVSSKVFDKKNGLPESSCYAVTEDSKGNLWMVTSANRVLHYENDSLKEAPFSKSFASANKGLMLAYQISFRKDSVIMNAQNAAYIAGINSTEVSRVPCDTTYLFYFIKEGDSLRINNTHADKSWIKRTADSLTVAINIREGAQTKYLSFTYKNNNRPNWRVLTAHDGTGENFISFDNLLIKLNPDYSFSLYELPTQILTMYCDKSGGLWLGTLRGGLRYYNDTRDMNNEITSLAGFSVTGVCVDNEDGVWCTTLEKGIFYSRNKNILNYSNTPGLDKAVSLLKNEGGGVFTSSGNNELIEFVNDSLTKFELDFLNNKAATDILKNEDSWIIAGSSVLIKTDAHFGNPLLIKAKRNDMTSGLNQIIFNTNSKRIFGICYGEIMEVVEDKSIDSYVPLASGGRYILAIDTNTFLYGCRDGLYELFPGSSNFSKYYDSKKIPGTRGMVNQIFRSSRNEIWITTRENGLYSYNGDSAVSRTAELKIPTERISDITEDRLGNIWLATNGGLVRLSPSGKTYHTTVYTVSNGLPSNDIFKLAADSNFIYFSSTEGLGRFSLRTELLNKKAPQVYLHSLTINEKLINTDGPFFLPYTDNSLALEFDALTFKNSSAKLLYHLKNANEKSFKEEIIKGNRITLDNLSPGTYELRVYAINNDGIKSDKPVILNFEIGKPFWQRAWFIISAVLFFGLLLFISVKLITKRIRKKEEEKTRINKQLAEFQLTALQAQMNPHFIFNAINSIQNYILKSEEQLAYNYLSKFSKLMRMVLNNSEQKTLTVYEELETVKLYIELEQLRFDKKFTFTLTISDDIDIHHVTIPTMLIQPYVENAIWHGLMNLEATQDGILGITISMWNSLLKIVIEDNGIGRVLAAQYRKESIHKPVAMKLTEKRLSVINMMEDYTGVNVTVNDLMDESGKPSGTRVEILLPM